MAVGASSTRVGGQCRFNEGGPRVARDGDGMMKGGRVNGRWLTGVESSLGRVIW